MRSFLALVACSSALALAGFNACGGTTVSDDGPAAGAAGSAGASTGGMGGTGGTTGGTGGTGLAEAGVDSATPEAGPDADAATPTSCDLALLGHGTFDMPASSGTVYSGPAVVATPTGFIITYREADPTTTQAVRLKISDQGEATRSDVALPSCDNLSSDGISAIWNETFGAGLMTVSSPACGLDHPRLHVSNFDSDGDTLAEYTYELPSRIRLSPVKALAPYGAKFFLAAMAGDAPFLYVFDGLSVQQDPAPMEIHKGNGAVTFVQVTTAPGMRSLLTDSDLEGGKLVLSVDDAQAGTALVSLSHGEVTSLTSWGKRTAVVRAAGDQLAWHVVSQDGGTLADGTLAGSFTATDVAQLHDHLLIVGAGAGSITVFRLDDANGTFSVPTAFQIQLASSQGVSLEDFTGERIAMAAAKDRIVVAWLTTTTTMAGTSTAPGGYAVLGCSP